jgi:hypothetical protein
MVNLLKMTKVEKKLFFHSTLRSPTGAKKNKSYFSRKTNTSFYSEFNADFEYVIIIEKYSWWKNGFSIVLPFFWVLSFYIDELVEKWVKKWFGAV